MIVNLKFENWDEQEFVFDLCHISTIPPGNYKLINTCADPDVINDKVPVRREIEIEIDINDEYDRSTVAEILKIWSKHYQPKVSGEYANNYKSEIDSIRKEQEVESILKDLE